MGLFDIFRRKSDKSAPPVVSVDQLADALLGGVGASRVTNYGDHWEGSFGDTRVYEQDFDILRKRSRQLFEDNMFAGGIIGRFVTNVIHTGLVPEAEPNEMVLGLPEDSLLDFTDEIENLQALWAGDNQCDYRKARNFGRMQADIYRQALIDGDVLVVYRQRGSRPLRVEVIDATMVESPLLDQTMDIPNGHSVEWGVEWDERGAEAAYWVRQNDGSHRRIQAFGASGRRLAKLVRMNTGLINRRRGSPLIAVLLHSLRELDRYRDATVRKALLNALVAIFIEKEENKLSSKPLAQGAVRRGTATAANSDGTVTERSINKFHPGLVLEELNVGEKPTVHSLAANDPNAGEFERFIIEGMAWSLNIPPAVLRLGFSSNYSANQGEINEWKLVLTYIRNTFADEFAHPTHVEWLLTECLAGRLSRWPEMLDAWRNRRKDPYRWQAWVATDWSGAIKPSADLVKTTKGYQNLLAMGAITHDRAARELTGMKFERIVKKLRRENEKLAEANAPLAPVESDSNDTDTDTDTGGEMEG